MSAPRSPGVRGRPFEKRNPGQKPGSKNKASLIAAALIDGELPELLRTAIEIAAASCIISVARFGSFFTDVEQFPATSTGV